MGSACCFPGFSLHPSHPEQERAGPGSPRGQEELGGKRRAKGNIAKDPRAPPHQIYKIGLPCLGPEPLVPAVSRGSRWKTLLCSSRILRMFFFTTSLDGSGIGDDVDCGVVLLQAKGRSKFSRAHVRF